MCKGCVIHNNVFLITWVLGYLWILLFRHTLVPKGFCWLCSQFPFSYFCYHSAKRGIIKNEQLHNNRFALQTCPIFISVLSNEVSSSCLILHFHLIVLCGVNLLAYILLLFCFKEYTALELQGINRDTATVFSK